MKMAGNFIEVDRDDKYPSGFGVDAKWVGNALDDIFSVMEEKEITIIPELQELKQYLRFKGNSEREQNNFKYWEFKSKMAKARAGEEITLTVKELKTLLCTKKNIETLAVTSEGRCLSWLNNPFCWFEGSITTRRNVYRKMAKQMNFLRKLQGKKPLEAGDKK